MENLELIRHDYLKSTLDKKDVLANPIKQFEIWLQEATNLNILEPTAMILSTTCTNAYPTSRIVLLKIIDKGFCFFSNYSSKKGLQLEENPKAALLFFWPELERQIRIQGMIEKLNNYESEDYFYKRPIGSQIAAISSPQSKEIPNRQHLELLNEKNKSDNPVKLDNWGGYRLLPAYFEFWQGRPTRLHDRIAYFKKEMNWQIKRLAP